jgi:TonB family protein
VATLTKVHGLTIVASVAFHAGVAALLSWIALRSLSGHELSAQFEQAAPSGQTGSPTIAIDLPTVGDGVLSEEEQPMDQNGEPPRITAGDTSAHLDTGSPGRGGDGRATAPALNLADRNERMRLSPDPWSRLDRDQLQRLRVARVRQSWEDRRSTTHPTELTLVVTGAGTVLERRTFSREATRGALESPSASEHGGSLGAAPAAVRAEGDRRIGGTEPGSRQNAPGLGIVEWRAAHPRRASAPIGAARPDVAQATVAVPADQSARPKDDTESDQEVATTVRSLVHASTAGGVAGEGQGGSGAGGEAGAGGASGAGSRAHPLGLGDGEVFDYWTSDPRLLPYFRQIHAKIDPLWANAFPKSALLELKQGTVILEFTVLADGRAVVSWPPVRPSGIDEFDRNCAEAIRRASPLPPVPPALAARSVRIRAPFVASNPVVK